MRRRPWLGAFLVLMLAAAACGGNNGDDDDAGDANQDTSGDEGEPVQGGTLVYGLEADTANGWAPYRTSCATSCYIPFTAVSDSLFAVNDDGEIVPLLAESVDHNDDYTEWTITLKDGIKFHDGTPLDADAVKFNIETCVGSPLTGAAYASVGPITASGQTVTIATKNGPWVALPAYFGYGACGYMFSKDWLSSLPDVPHRSPNNPFYDAALAATPADGDPAAPIGLGAFKFESYEPGNGNSFRAVRNEDYWRGPNGITGENLPYLDAIEAVASVDIDSRANALRSGEFDIMHTANAETIAELMDDDSVETVTSDRYGETNYIMLNTAQGTNLMTGAQIDPQGANADNPMLNLHCRRALAHGIDLDRLAEERGGGISTPANGPFPPGSRGYLEDSGYPAYDIDAAQAEMDTCLSDLGTDSISFDFNTTNDPFNVETNTLIVSMWQEAFGDEVNANITPIEQGQYIGIALLGNFDVFAWRNHGGTDPDQQLLWWISAASAPIGSQALNFGRFSDEVIDENLITIRTNPDEDARTEAAENINKRFGEEVYNLWTSWTIWGISSQPYVNDQVLNTLPDGSKGIELAFAGRHQLNQIWCDNGECE
ncbi:MAG TPA: ABC transporter substrate-binding protein [Acidimicrobiales bacterium]|nr:ABC transporter substrate-binding protein [Acidimicrobiales bacterium]